MANISYVYPNVSSLQQRGGFDERWELAQEHGCTYIEVPADFIKNKTEVSRTGLDLCAVPDQAAIKTLYENHARCIKDVRYILHTEPSLRRTDGYGISAQALLKWYDPEWRERFVRMVLEVSEFLGKPAARIEIHPGDRRNHNQDLIDSVIFLQDAYESAFGTRPDVLLENRTGQCIQDGNTIKNLADEVAKESDDLQASFGCVLDVQQLYTVTKERCFASFDEIPPGFLKGFHIHRKHGAPSLDDPIPWEKIFAKIRTFDQEMIINPEIHHKNRVGEVIGFCRGLVG
ncbi:hypothetical protein J2129_000854 [Methanofollis sp. W23]|uniref:hypothetical protein n=1 Tax=Methanofollis sp. W23 TaxID=2817849 RepID=UPI001AEAAF70|nr:hypothetical protein [Methanofollis sp. W23]MBP2145400.1 hypothetical protein [Methanofollis sp. W23]